MLIAWKPLGHPPAAANAALGVVLLLVFLIQAAFNAWQDFSSMKVLNSIKSMLPSECLVLRDATQVQIPASEIVPGDVVFVRMGDKIAADLRMVQVSLDLKFDKSILTGESRAIAATVDATDPKYLETHNIALQGTHCIGGSGIGIACDTGDRTMFGRIATLSNRPRVGMTPLQKELLRFILLIVFMVLVVVILVVVLW